jgi:cell division protein FtsL
MGGLTNQGLSEKFDKVQTMTMGVFAVALVAVVIAVVSPIVDAWRFRAASYEALDQRVSDQNKIIGDLKEEIKDLNTALGVKKTIEAKLPTSIEIKKELKLEGN